MSLTEKLERARLKRHFVYETWFSARALCTAGFMIMPVVLFSPAVIRLSIFLLFWFLAWLCGKKNNPLITISIFISIVAFNILPPRGELLAVIGALHITSGALQVGAQRASTLSALVMLSRVTIRRDLKLPGLFGELIGESLRLYSLIMNQKHRIRRKTLINDIDSMLIQLSSAEDYDSGNIRPAVRTRRAGLLILSFVVLVCWLIWIAFTSMEINF